MAATVGNLFRSVLRLANDPAQNIWVCPLLLLADAGLTAGVVWKIPYTEIDWRAYMQQVAQINAGERNYAKIRGDTGPLVYPAGHVWIYRLLSTITSDGSDIFTAQLVFAALYLVTLATVMLCYHRARVPPYVFPLLVLSKRLHSVYVLRLFNDCWAVLGLWLAIALFQSRHVKAAALAFSLGLAVKMSLLLALPGVAVLLYMGQGPWAAIGSLLVMVQYQVLLAWPFLAAYPREYLARAFEFSRVFLFKWTVNWRFLGEDRFLSEGFSTSLLAVHASLLGLFALTRWIVPTEMNVLQIVGSFITPPTKRKQDEMARKIAPDFVLNTILVANTIGMLCARSLHYQFYAWLAWGSPYLLWRTGWHPVAVVIVWLAQEVAWNVYPSSPISSAGVVGCLAAQVSGVWAGTGAGMQRRATTRPKSRGGPGNGQQK
ncbi:hypothetical protein ANO11243_065650 [Dothideomycetidae sp. 11243]|nr:hypothetical protein ANO11243_065650 [fungal sp. No.11243]